MTLPEIDKKNNANKDKPKNNNKVIATDYAKGSGLKNLVNFKGGKVFVGGQEIKDFYIDSDNKAHVDKDEMDAAIQKTKDSIGIKENVYDENGEIVKVIGEHKQINKMSEQLLTRLKYGGASEEELKRFV